MSNPNRTVKLTYYKHKYNFVLEGKGRHGKNRHLSLFSFTQQEAEDVYKLLGKNMRDMEHKLLRVELDESD